MRQSQLNQSKDILRAKCKEVRRELLECEKMDDITSKIVQKIKNADFFKNAKHVLLYYPKKGEISLLDLICEDKKFYLPKCEGENLKICPYCKNKLARGNFGVLEPLTDEIKGIGLLDLVFVPALCADKKCMRLGYGKGFYDRFLNDENLHAKTVVCVPKCLHFDEIPTGEFDKKCDVVVTE